MSTVDWLIVAVLGVSILISVRRGFVNETLSLLTWIAGFVVAKMFGPGLATLLEPWVETAPLRTGASYVLLFVGVLILGGLVNRQFSELVKFSGLEGTDRFLGVFFGLARGSLFVLAAVAGLDYLAPVQDYAWWRDSTLIPEVLVVVEQFAPLVQEQGGRFFDTTDVKTSMESL